MFDTAGARWPHPERSDVDTVPKVRQLVTVGRAAPSQGADGSRRRDAVPDAGSTRRHWQSLMWGSGLGQVDETAQRIDEAQLFGGADW